MGWLRALPSLVVACSLTTDFGSLQHPGVGDAGPDSRDGSMPAPDVSIAVNPATVVVCLTMAGTTDAIITRNKGFTGAINVTVGSPPLNVMAGTVIVTPDATTGKLNFTAGDGVV